MRFVLISALSTWLGLAFAQPAPAPIEDRIKPVLTRNCLGCHNAQVKQAGLDLSTRDGLLRGSENGPVVVPGNPDSSHLYKVITHAEQPAMPFKSAKLSDETLALIAEWIKSGVPYPAGGPASPTAETAKATPLVDHWAFRKPVRVEPPSVKGNPIDAFLAAERTKRKLTASPEADRRTLIRRIYLDLTGLTPEPDQVTAFLRDKSPDAYEKVVDRLLASNEYGERWGRHWLDIWRYSDWYGWRKENQVRYSQRHIWRWRDWVVESINKNTGYDKMIVAMLAGDEIAPSDPDMLRATGYLARSWYRFNRNIWLQDAAEYTATSFLGLTMKCARCHTHKYDPIPHTDYYRFRAFFEPYNVRTDRVVGETDIEKGGLVRSYDADITAPTFRFVRGNEANPEKDKPLTPGLPAFLDAKLEIKPIPLSLADRFPDGREFVRADAIAKAEADISKAKADLSKARQEMEKASMPVASTADTPAATWTRDASAVKKAQQAVTAAEKHLATVEADLPALRARIAADRATIQETPASDAEQLGDESRKLERKANVLRAEEELFHANIQMEEAAGNEKKLAAAKKRLEAAVKALSEAQESYTPLGKLYPATSSGRRLALANWITSRDNPLTARVAVNHIWLRHFGKALVPTVFNFGKSGKAPSHPELLDWLAVEFMDSGWDMKHVHRLIVTSQAYRMSSKSQSGDPNSTIDPDNVFLWRMNTRRMEAEAVRDSMLLLAGKLDRAMGGPELDERKGEEVFRRSLYFRHSPDLQMEMLQVFDLANANECFERTESVMPQQALAMSNSNLSYTVARTIAQSIASSGPKPVAFVANAFDRVLGRPPSAAESAESIKFLASQASLYADRSKLSLVASKDAPLVSASEDPEQRARESLVHVLLNHNEFVTIR